MIEGIVSSTLRRLGMPSLKISGRERALLIVLFASGAVFSGWGREGVGRRRGECSRASVSSPGGRRWLPEPSGSGRRAIRPVLRPGGPTTLGRSASPGSCALRAEDEKGASAPVTEVTGNQRAPSGRRKLWAVAKVGLPSSRCLMRRTPSRRGPGRGRCRLDARRLMWGRKGGLRRHRQNAGATQ